MDDDLMFSMEEEGSAQRPSAQRNGLKHRAHSLGNASDDDEDEEHFISPILCDSAKEVCNYLKDLVYTRQLSNSLPKSNFLYRVSSSECCQQILKLARWLLCLAWSTVYKSSVLQSLNICLKRTDDPCMPAHTHPIRVVFVVCVINYAE